MRGHALRVHQAEFVDEATPLRTLAPEALQARLLAFRRGQLSSAQRRRMDACLEANLGDLVRGGGSAGGSPPGLLAGSVRAGDRPSGAAVSETPVLSAGVLPPVAVAPAAVFSPPGDRLPGQMADWFLDRLGLRPSTLERALFPAGADPASNFWIRVLAELQRAIGRRLRDVIEDGLAADPTGRVAQDQAVNMICRLFRRPLDDHDD